MENRLMVDLATYWPLGIAVGGWIVSVEVRHATMKQKLTDMDKKLDLIIKKLFKDEIV